MKDDIVKFLEDERVEDAMWFSSCTVIVFVVGILLYRLVS